MSGVTKEFPEGVSSLVAARGYASRLRLYNVFEFIQIIRVAPSDGPASVRASDSYVDRPHHARVGNRRRRRAAAAMENVFPRGCRCGTTR